MTKFAVMVTNLSDNSDFKAKLIALAHSKYQAINAAENYIQTIIEEYAENGIDIVFDNRILHASDKYGTYAWSISIQEIKLDMCLTLK